MMIEKLAQRSPFTERQGQVLAYIQAYTVVNRRPPAQSDIAEFFSITGPAVHQMLATLQKRGWLERVPGAPRSMRALVPPQELPVLEPSVAGPLPVGPTWVRVR